MSNYIKNLEGKMRIFKYLERRNNKQIIEKLRKNNPAKYNYLESKLKEVLGDKFINYDIVLDKIYYRDFKSNAEEFVCKKYLTYLHDDFEYDELKIKMYLEDRLFSINQTFSNTVNKRADLKMIQDILVQSIHIITNMDIATLKKYLDNKMQNKNVDHGVELQKNYQCRKILNFIKEIENDKTV